MALRKFDPIVNQYVIFNEAKLKYSTTIQRPAPSMFAQYNPFQQLRYQPRAMPLAFGAATAFTAAMAWTYAPTNFFNFANKFQPKI